ncbi:FAD dependent oxidoreductase-domain-containing protein [Annulohypoxylon stygium]|nr:FAD dependent oxidoreductase-domain-containing protein [Annulohypoxylon stygium]
MGAVQSSAKNVALASKAYRDLKDQLKAVVRRLSSEPGLPSENPTRAYWKQDPPFPDLVHLRMIPPTNRTEIAIIGSGITAAAIAWTYLDECRRSGNLRRVVVFESRDLAGGATSRNGGHLKIVPHQQFDELRRHHGPTRAAAIIRFQLSHIKTFLEMCEEKNWDMAECREVETVDYFLTDEERDNAFAKVDAIQKYIPDLTYTKYNAQEVHEKFPVDRHVKGALSYSAGAIHPYRFVSCVWKELLQEYKNVLYIRTNAPVISIRALRGRSHAYEIVVDELETRTWECNHIVHATNAFATQFVPGLRGRLTGVLGTVSMMRPGKLFGDSDPMSSWYICYGHSCDYAIQRPTVNGVQGDVILGGGFSRSEGQGANTLGVWDESRLEPLPSAHLRGIFPTIFRNPLHHSLTGRKPATSELLYPDHEPGEWICAGYNGDGLMQAWLCGTALGIMLAQREEISQPKILGRPLGTLRSWFPPEMEATPKRVQKATLANLGHRFFWSLLSRRYADPAPDLENDSDSVISGNGILPLLGDIPFWVFM